MVKFNRKDEFTLASAHDTKVEVWDTRKGSSPFISIQAHKQKINGIDWSLKVRNRDVFEYIKALVKIRKEHPAFRMRTADQIQANIRFEEHLPEGVVGYVIDGAAMRDDWRRIRVYYNGGHIIQKLFMEVKNWKLAVRNNRLATGEIIRDHIILQPFSCNILYLEIPRQNHN